MATLLENYAESPGKSGVDNACMSKGLHWRWMCCSAGGQGG